MQESEIKKRHTSMIQNFRFQEYKSRDQSNKPKNIKQMPYIISENVMAAKIVKKIIPHTENLINESKIPTLNKIKTIFKIIPPIHQKNKRIWEQELNLNLSFKNPNIKKLIAQSISFLIRERVYDAMFPDLQNINQRLFKLYLIRIKLILQNKHDAIFKQDSIFYVRQDLCSIFSQNFLIHNQSIVKNIESIIMAFCTHRLDIGHMRSLTQLVIILYSLFNKNTMLVFSHFCNIVCCKTLINLISKNESEINNLNELIEQRLEQQSTAMYVIIFKKCKIPLKSYLHTWILSMFTSILFESNNYKLDFLFFQDYMLLRQDILLDKIFNYLFLNKFSEEAIIQLCIAIHLSIQKQLMKSSNNQNVYQILRKPKIFMDMNVFDTYLFK